ncbi:lysozyme-like domain-containing protein [Cladochytrium replicatum]|nr:lysozyme-like domain-containing protein [Cladochytrium replicatum]
MFWFTILAAATTTALVGATDVAPCEKSIIQQLTNYYENSRFQFSFDYCENLGDGRGFTAGVAGFTTGTHDALEVIKAYVEKMDGEPTEFDGMLDRLKEISREKEGLNSDVAGLSGYCRAWETASNNPVFRQAQMEALDANAWTPSQAMADKLGLNLTITRGFLYDGWIMQGSGDDPDSMEAIIKRAAKAVEKATSLDGIPSKGRDEIEFLKSMFRQRFRVFTNPTDSATKDEWTAAVGRLYSYFFLFCTGQDTFTDAVDALDFDYKLLNVTCDTSIEVCEQYR